MILTIHTGKTTKIPQIILDDLLENAGKSNINKDSNDAIGCNCIAVTQPRRVGAMTVSQRVATERGCRLGEEASPKILML